MNDSFDWNSPDPHLSISLFGHPDSDITPGGCLQHYTWTGLREAQATNPGSEPSALWDENYTLTNIPHPLFRREAWRDHNRLDDTETIFPADLHYTDSCYDVPEEFYCRIYPALQLATIFLQRARPFLVHVLRGPLHQRPDEDPGHFQLDQHWAPAIEDYAALDNELLILAQNLVIFWIAEEENTSPGGSKRYCGVYENIEVEDPDDPGFCLYRLPTIVVDSEILGYVNRNTWLTTPDRERASLLLGVAGTLVHEIGHALWVRRCVIAENNGTYETSRLDREIEPLISREHPVELGHQLETWLFGFAIHIMSRDSDGHLAEAGRELRDGRAGMNGLLIYGDESPDDHYVLTYKTVLDMFDRRTWETGRPLDITFHDIFNPDILEAITLQRVFEGNRMRTHRTDFHLLLHPDMTISPPPDRQRRTAPGNRRLAERRM